MSHGGPQQSGRITAVEQEGRRNLGDDLAGSVDGRQVERRDAEVPGRAATELARHQIDGTHLPVVGERAAVVLDLHVDVQVPTRIERCIEKRDMGRELRSGRLSNRSATLAPFVMVNGEGAIGTQTDVELDPVGPELDSALESSARDAPRWPMTFIQRLHKPSDAGSLSGEALRHPCDLPKHAFDAMATSSCRRVTLKLPSVAAADRSPLTCNGQSGGRKPDEASGLTRAQDCCRRPPAPAQHNRHRL